VTNFKAAALAKARVRWGTVIPGPGLEAYDAGKSAGSSNLPLSP
jgi:hypothetical protein